MSDVVCGLVSFAIAAFAFTYGAIRLFKKKKPLYLQLLICAAGCFALEQFSYVVNLWCGVTASVSIGMLGIFGCNFFLLSANYGTLDKIVDDGSRQNTPAKIGAAAAPAVIGILTVITVLSWWQKDTFCAVMWLIMLLPALPASYFNLKHVLLPLDPFEFLKATKLCNTAALCFYTVTEIYAVCSATLPVVGDILSIMMSLSVLGLVLAADKGEKLWGI